MNKEAAELLNTLGAMRTLVQMFPLNILKGIRVESIDSPIDIIVACLSMVGITDKEIFSFILSEVLGVDVTLNDPDALQKDLNNIDNREDEFKRISSPFLYVLNSELKSLIAGILANIISCSIHPKIPKDILENYNGTPHEYPLSLIDPEGILNLSPFDSYGQLFYSGIKPKDKDGNGGTVPSELAHAKDMNAFLWYGLHVVPYKTKTPFYRDKKNLETTDTPLYKIENKGYSTGLQFYVSNSYSGSTLYRFNDDYLMSIDIISFRSIIVNIIDEFLNGLPNAKLSIGMQEIMTRGMVDKIIKTVVDSDDDKDGVIINDCFYSFSNEEWDEMLQENELRKYNAISLDLTNDGVTVIDDKEEIAKTLTETQANATKFDQKTKIEKTLYDIAATGAVDTVLENTVGLSLAYNSQWLMNIISSIVRPIVRSIFSPKVMLLLAVNYDIAGVVDFRDIDFNDIGAIFDLLKKKLIGMLVRLINKIKDEIIKKLLEFFYEKVLPLVALYMSKLLLENLDYYLRILTSALDCLLIVTFNRRGVPTQIDDVNYADIIPTQITPPNSIC